MAARTDAPLAGLRILVTRPAAQAPSLCAMIESKGGEALHLPAIVVSPPADPEGARRLLRDRAGAGIVIFVSRNAVASAIALVPELPGLLEERPVFATGQGTRGELSRHGVAHAVAPAAKEGSAGLLLLDALKHAAVSGRKVLIVRGEGGRELLRAALRKRGADVRYAEVYSRRRPDPGELDDVWRSARPDIIVTTSNQGLENIVEIAGRGIRRALFATPLVVTSRRARARAAELGFRARIVAAPSADDAVLLRSLARLGEELRDR
jgi:uroporphyrinogen-III synthase